MARWLKAKRLSDGKIVLARDDYDTKVIYIKYEGWQPIVNYQIID